MAAYGRVRPKRVVTANDSHTPAAPYNLVNNDASLLDASDLVFIDAPGTGFSRIAGKDKEKAFWGVDEDANAFANFITEFLSKYGRWNSPKYLFGESYGTTRNAVLVNILETDRDVDFNGVIMLSQILNFDLSPDRAGSQSRHGSALSACACRPMRRRRGITTSCPAHRPISKSFWARCSISRWAITRKRLQAGAALNTKQRNTIAAKLHQYTGLPVSYILKADLRIDGGEFEKNLQDSSDMTTGRLDTRFSGPTIDPLSQGSRLRSAIRGDFVGLCLGFQRLRAHATALWRRQEYKAEPEEVYKSWDYVHTPPNSGSPQSIAPNVIPDLSDAMKYNPDLRVMLNAGYFDLATPYYEGVYEMRHLQIPRALQSNIEIEFYHSGHMVYANEDSLQELHDNVAAFIRATDNQAGR